MERIKRSDSFKKAKESRAAGLFKPPDASQANRMVAQEVPCLMIPAVMIGLFYANMASFIGDKTCFVNEIDGVAYEIGTGAAGEIDVAAEWKTYSLVGMIFWGVFLLGSVARIVAGCATLCGDNAALAAVPIGVGSGCCSIISLLCIVGLTVWGFLIRFDEVGKTASKDLLRESGTAMAI